MAWLNATPKPPEGSKPAKAAEKQPQLSRMNAMKRDKIVPKMPPNPAPKLIERWIEIGMSEAAGMGAAPLSWREIEAWKAATGIAIPPWEARLIRKLSVEYLAESRRAESETCPPPWRTEVTQKERDAELARLMLVLG